MQGIPVRSCSLTKAEAAGNVCGPGSRYVVYCGDGDGGHARCRSFAERVIAPYAQPSHLLAEHKQIRVSQGAKLWESVNATRRLGTLRRAPSVPHAGSTAIVTTLSDSKVIKSLRGKIKEIAEQLVGLWIHVDLGGAGELQQGQQGQQGCVLQQLVLV
ncbi:uncharacterized protein Triagg1_8000 [Trichoderma aggressivum f. europaeum]|uniref:Uncharacterized protein n=1 Tax=Trichoderma aggressivum f. europaeum TaxID=173218 RepID=A0AAE1LY90_9HYPO|nr:hypothetical protein Triagg1_8000 [Trichoderma aggressivum f. europaeum]